MVVKNHRVCLLAVLKTAWLFLVLILLNSVTAKAGKVSVSFRESGSSLKSTELATNMLKIINGSAKDLSFYVELNLPQGWTSLKSTHVLYKLSAGDSMFIPVKVAVNSNEEGNISYLINASLLSQADQLQFASASWKVQLKMESHWAATVDKTEAYFTNHSDTSSVTLSVHNTGNSVEWYTVKVAPHFRLQVFDKSMAVEAPPFFNFNLMPGADTVIQFVIKSKEDKKGDYRDHDSNEYNNASGEKYPLRISVQSQPKDQSNGRTWKTSIDFRRNSNETQFNPYSRLVLPLTMEMRMDNLFDQSTALSLNLYGNARLSLGRSLSYRYQSFFSQQYYNEKAFKGNYHYLGYFTPRSFVEIGNITGWGNFGYTPSGRGIRGEYSLGKNKIGLLYIQNPDLFLGVTSRTAGIHHELALKKFALINYYQQSWNEFNKVNGNLFISGINYQLRSQHLFSGRAGTSNENYYGASIPFSKTGYGGNFNYSGTIKDFSLYLNSNYGTKYYTAYRGISSLNYAATYRQNKTNVWTFTNSYYRQQPVYFDVNGNALNSFKSKSDKYELRYSITNKANNYAVGAAYYNDDFLNIHYQTRGVGFDIHPASKGDLRFVSNIFASYIKLPDYSIPDYFTAQVRTSLRYKSLTTNIRYNYGPYQAYEHLRFATYRINHQSVYLNTYYGFWLLANKISVEPSFNYSYETLYKRTRLSFRPQFYYFSKSGWQFNMYAEYIFNSQKITSLDNSVNLYSTENPDQTSVYKDLVFGVGLKKQFGIPVTGKKYFTTGIVIFKDINGNGRQDKNEEAIENVLVSIKPIDIDSSNRGQSFSLTERGDEVITDSKGRVTFRNLPRGTYKITAKPLIENSGWFSESELTLMLDKTKEIEIPFSHGVRIIGSISVDKNSFSANGNKNPDLTRIRVTAVDSAGKTYSTLTSEEGRFEIYVPAGEFRISINQKAIGDGYLLEQNSIPVSLVGGMEAFNITFRIKEKERQMKVKKFGKSENH
ncbi:hypothetical protein BH11BAC1_BH11BAC1_04190 [soil metagenome]